MSFAPLLMKVQINYSLSDNVFGFLSWNYFNFGRFFNQQSQIDNHKSYSAHTGDKMKKISKIMVAYDFSKYSKDSLEYAVELAENLKADIIITNVINEKDVNSIRMAAMYSGAISEDEFIKDKTESRLKRIDELIEKISHGRLSIKKLFKVGIPFRELIQAVKDEKVDLVVMGPKGRSNLEDILFGSTAEKMFRHCPVPLLSIRENKSR